MVRGVKHVLYCYRHPALVSTWVLAFLERVQHVAHHHWVLAGSLAHLGSANREFSSHNRSPGLVGGKGLMRATIAKTVRLSKSCVCAL